MVLIARRRSPLWSRFVALLSAVAITLALGASASATGSKTYTATWVSGGSTVANPPNTIGIPSGNVALTLRVKNHASVSLGSANITPPAGYTLNSGSVSPGTATVEGGTLKLRSLNLGSGASRDVTINVTTSCVTSGSATWTIAVKRNHDFSGDVFTRKSGTSAPSSSVAGQCQLRFLNQPNDTTTGALIRDGRDSTGDPVSVEIYDPGTDARINVSADVNLTPDTNPGGGTLTGGSVNAIAGLATFPDLSLDTPGRYTLKASSAAASNEPVSNPFDVSDSVETCSGAGCTFTDTQDGNSYSTIPVSGSAGATWSSSLNLPGLRISCDFAPFNYPDARQPNTVWYLYDDGNSQSSKINIIRIDKSIVQATPDNAPSKYRVCYSAPDPFKDRTGNMAQPDPWEDGPSAYFGTTWYTGLLPDCSIKKLVKPCMVGWIALHGDRIGTFLTPAGDPSYR
jgi:hypothetical protein